MPDRSPSSRLSAARQRLDVQLERLAELPPDAPVRSIRPQSEDATRFAIRIGRAQFGPVHAEDVEPLALEIGRPAEPPARDRLADALAREAARADALRLLRARARARQDLVNRLLRKGHDRQHAAAAADRLARAGLLDDEALARDRAERLAEAGRVGPRGAEAKLRTLGLSRPVATGAVAGAFEGVDLLGQATEAAARRARSIGRDLDDQTRRRRLFGFLARRGYDHETCRQAVDRALRDEPTD